MLDNKGLILGHKESNSERKRMRESECVLLLLLLEFVFVCGRDRKLNSVPTSTFPKVWTMQSGGNF